MEVVIVVLLVVLIAAVLVRPFVTVATVHDYQRGLRYRQGRFVGLLDPGTHVADPAVHRDPRPGRPADLDHGARARRS